jgi:hypothetical protein
MIIFLNSENVSAAKIAFETQPRVGFQTTKHGDLSNNKIACEPVKMEDLASHIQQKVAIQSLG